MATVGEQLIEPEDGWKRYDDKDANFQLIGSWSQNNNSNAYSGSFTRVNSANEHKIKFKVFSSKLRILTGFSNATNISHNNSIKINDEIVNFSCQWPGNTSGCVVAYEKIFDSKRIIEVEITAQQSKIFLFDGIDIDSDGFLLHPYLNLQTNISKMKTGDYIPCKYTASSNQVGVFSDLGTEGNILPVSPVSEPSGCFNFIMVGYDEKGRKKLVADRVIQNGIAWDTLNGQDLIYGRDLTNNFSDKANCKMIFRVLSGSEDLQSTFNEYDKIIKEYDLNGIIKDSDTRKYIWNYSSQYEHSCTISSYDISCTAATNETTRSKVRYNYTDSASTGYRPVMLVDVLKVNKYLFKDEEGYKTYNNGFIRIDEELSSEIFKTYGLDDLILDKSILKELVGKFKVLVHNSDTSDYQIAILKSIPKQQLVLPNGDIHLDRVKNINSLNIAGVGAKVLISNDNGITYKSIKDKDWIDVNLNDENLFEKSISIDGFNSIPLDMINNLLLTNRVLRVAYILTENSTIYNISMEADLYGNLMQAGLEITYDVEYVDTKKAAITIYKDGSYIINEYETVISPATSTMLDVVDSSKVFNRINLLVEKVNEHLDSNIPSAIPGVDDIERKLEDIENSIDEHIY